ncbi:MAG: DUF4262 domain-containing protein [Motilibacteraceae bacterium]
MIERYGWMVQGVEADSRSGPWAYTVGLTRCGLPELVVTGSSLQRAGQILNGYGAHLQHAPAPRPGEQLELYPDVVAEVVEVPVPFAHLKLAVELYGPEVRALQLVTADEAGRWPWDRRYRGRWRQPVLGPRTTPGPAGPARP